MTTHAGFLDRITVDPDVCDGKAVIKGTQVSVSLLLAAITDGDSIVEVASCYASPRTTCALPSPTPARLYGRTEAVPRCLVP